MSTAVTTIVLLVLVCTSCWVSAVNPRRPIRPHHVGTHPNRPTHHDQYKTMILSLSKPHPTEAPQLPKLPDPSMFFTITFVDVDTGVGIPLVQIRTSHYVNRYADSNGIIAFYDASLMDTTVWFSVLTDGYNLVNPATVTCDPDDPNDPRGACDPGVFLVTKSGGSVTIQMKRWQLAQRLFRLTGASLYQDTVLSGKTSPIQYPLLDISGATGQDTVITGQYKGKNYWFFGDTVCARSQRQDNCDGYGMFTVGATSCIPTPQSIGTCSPSVHPNLEYFACKDPQGVYHVCPMAPIGNLTMNTWIGGVYTLYKGMANETMYSVYYKPFDFGPFPTPPVVGMAIWNDTLSQFVAASVFPDNHPMFLSGDHVVEVLDPATAAANTRGYVYMFSPVTVRIAAADVLNIDNFETFTPLKQGSTMAHPVLDPSGWSWKKGMELFGIAQEAALIQQKVLPPSMVRYQSVDITTGAAASMGNGGSVNWNSYLKLYVRIDGPYLGLSRNITGPWPRVIPILSFNRTGMVCYNPQQITHMNDNQFSDQFVFYSCSYTAMWSNQAPPPPTVNLWSTCLFGQNSHLNCATVVPNYEYNNLVHKVDLKQLVNEGIVKKLLG